MPNLENRNSRKVGYFVQERKGSNYEGSTKRILIWVQIKLCDLPSHYTEQTPIANIQHCTIAMQSVSSGSTTTVQPRT